MRVLQSAFLLVIGQNLQFRLLATQLDIYRFYKWLLEVLLVATVNISSNQLSLALLEELTSIAAFEYSFFEQHG